MADGKSHRESHIPFDYRSKAALLRLSWCWMEFAEVLLALCEGQQHLVLWERRRVGDGLVFRSCFAFMFGIKSCAYATSGRDVLRAGRGGHEENPPPLTLPPVSDGQCSATKRSLHAMYLVLSHLFY